jgi:MFS transporter, FHS family, glucose/mannose:H+ symporter
MKNLPIKISLFINYFVFAILLNSVGTLILQVQNNFGVSETDASILELCKDFSIAIASFLVSSFFTRLGYKRAMLLGLAIVTLACLAMPSLSSFTATKLLCVAVGASFALIKMSVYSTIGLITKDEKEHLGLMNFIESFFMIGILSGGFLFASFVDKDNLTSTSWFSAYYVLSGLSALAFVLLFTAPLDESSLKAEATNSFEEEFSSMLELLQKPLVLVFVSCAFLFVLMEQGIMNWLPTFNNKVLKIPVDLSIQMATIMALSIAVGRFLAGLVSSKISWYVMLSVCLLAAGTLVVLVIPMAANVDASTITSFVNAPKVAFIFPLIGLFLAPIYPAISSLILSKLPKGKHGVMSSLIIVFSALGGTIGSRITATIFQTMGGEKAFYFSLLPIAMLLVALFFFKKLLAKN